MPENIPTIYPEIISTMPSIDFSLENFGVVLGILSPFNNSAILLFFYFKACNKTYQIKKY